MLTIKFEARGDHGVLVMRTDDGRSHDAVGVTDVGGTAYSWGYLIPTSDLVRTLAPRFETVTVAKR